MESKAKTDQRRKTLMEELDRLPPARRQKVIDVVKAMAGRPKGPIKTKG